MVPIPGTFSWPLAARGKPRRGMLRRAVFSDVQRKALEKMFQKQKYISKPDRKKLASKLGLKDSQVNSPARAPTSGDFKGDLGWGKKIELEVYKKLTTAVKVISTPSWCLYYGCDERS